MELFYRSNKKLMAVPMSAGAGLAPGKPKELFEEDFLGGDYDPVPYYDVAPDGKHFYFFQKSKQTEQQPRIEVVLNWFEELKRRVPPK